MEFVKNTGTAKIDKLLGGASDDFPYNWNTYTQPAAQYYLDNYSSADDWTVANLSNVSFVGTGDGLNLFSLYINPGALLNSDPLTAINTLIHEPQHDFSQRGMGHDAIRIYNVDESGNIIDADDSNEDTYQQYVVENWSNRINDALRLAATAASITPTNGCCVTEPNKDKEIKNKLQSIYCKCGQQY
jgi:hypothetical protein